MSNQYTEEGKKNKLNYIRRYNKEKYRQITLMIRTDDPEQAELWDWLHTKYSTAGYLRDLALEAMRAEKKKG